MRYARPLAAVALLAVGACSGFGNPNPPGTIAAEPAARTARPNAGPIRHVVFIIQENRSFNNFFMGFPGAKTQRYGDGLNGNKIPLHSQNLASYWDIDHSSYAFFAACNGTGRLPGTKCRMNGWNDEQAGYGAPKNFAYAYVPQSQIAPYWTMAHQYVLADHMFASNLDGSFIAHQYAVAAFASSAVNYPTEQWGCEGNYTDVSGTLTRQRTQGNAISVCFNNPTIASEADAAGVSLGVGVACETERRGEPARPGAPQINAPVTNSLRE